MTVAVHLLTGIVSILACSQDPQEGLDPFASFPSTDSRDVLASVQFSHDGRRAHSHSAARC